MDIAEIRGILANVIRDAIEDVNRREWPSPAADLEELIPELRRRYLGKPGYEYITNLYHLVDAWVDAMFHDRKEISDGVQTLTVEETERVLLEAASALERGDESSDPRILAFRFRSVAWGCMLGCLGITVW